MERKKVNTENRYFSKELETMSSDALEKYQFEKTKETLERAYSQSVFYKGLFNQSKVKPDDFKSLDDIRRFPLIDKKELVKDQEENPPLGGRANSLLPIAYCHLN